MRRQERQTSDIKDIESIISASDVCRVAFAGNNIPYIVTMNFGYSGGEEKCLYFHCANEGKKMDMIRMNNYVCFEMDTNHELYRGARSCDWGMRYSSVIGYGYITVITGNELKKKALDCIMSHYSMKEKNIYDEKILERTSILRLDIKEITGKKC